MLTRSVKVWQPVGLGVLILATVIGCAKPTSPGGGFDIATARGAAISAFVAAESTTTTGGGSDTGGTYSSYIYSPAAGGSATVDLYNSVGSLGTPNAAAWGRVVFSSYVDATTGYTLNGTLTLVYAGTASTPPYTEYDDITGTVTYDGSQGSGTVTFDCLVTTAVVSATSRSFTSIEGTLQMGGIYYDPNTGATVATPTPTVMFSMSSAAAIGTATVALTATGADAIYYTLDVTIPTTSSSLYSAPISPAGDAVLAYAVKAGVPGRVSLVVFPLGT